MNAYDDANRFGKDAMDNALKSLSVMTRGFQQIATETGEFAKQSYEQSAQMAEKLGQVRSLDRALEVQNEFARSAYERWMTQATKMGEIYTDIAKEAYKPFEQTATAAAERGAAFASKAADAAKNAA